jgi:ABC-type transporter Mla subunit MlaD
MKNKIFYLAGILPVLLSSPGCSWIQPEYVLYVRFPKDCDVTKQSNVLWEGKEIGRVNKITATDSNMVILDLMIDKQVNLPASSTAECSKNLLGETFIKLTSPTKIVTTTSGYLHAMDTLHGRYVDHSRILDSVNRKKIINKLLDLKNTVDSIIADSISK